MNVHDRDITEM